jgi:hypothetical protein
MEATLNAWREETKDCRETMEACLEDTGANQEMSEIKMKAYPERLEACQENA